jgi:phage terminase Nu1 subunit (DNA packaging protein)
MHSYPIQYYAKRRQECLAAAETVKLPNEKRRHLTAAQAWQQIIERFDRTKVRPTSDALNVDRGEV